MMKNKLFFLLVLTNVVFCQAGPESDPLLVVVLMVKDEQEVIEKTVKPFVDAGINSFVIYDTGSTDNTVKVMQDFFDKNKAVNGYIEQEKFIDFASSRNRALAIAEDKFPHAGFIIMPDAEWYIHNAEGLLRFCRSCVEKNESVSSYLVRIVSGKLDFYTPRLIRCEKGVRFIGLVHEVLNEVASHKVPSGVFFEHKAGEGGKQKTMKRWERDRDLLLEEYKKNPRGPRILFYLAQTYDCLGDLENARQFYTLRVSLHGWDEEDYMAHYRLAQVVERSDDWHNALHYYLQAHQMRPHRIEPLIRIAQRYWNERKMALCFLFAKYAAEFSYPKDDVLFIEKDLYNYDCFDILGRCAWYVGEFDIGEQAIRKALEIHPEMIHLHRNLAYYINRKERACFA